MDKQKISSLLEKYKDGSLSSRELEQLNAWYRSVAQADGHYPDAEKAVQKRMLDRLNLELGLEAFGAEHRPAAANSRGWRRVALAAAAVAAVTLGAWLYYSSSLHFSRHAELVSASPLANDIAPGRNTAILTLANGTIINLDTNKTSVTVTDSVKAVMMLTASTPRGGTYQVVLPDGTRVWLNADSKISFPSQFAGKQRKIKLVGEAYFEVYRDKAKPFIVESSGQEVEVLGTHFNINSYADEGVTKTTLLEGSVRVTTLLSKSEVVTLKPNQQASLNGDALQVKGVDAVSAIAWKNGAFIFNDEPLESIMRKLARWYNVDLRYQDADRKEMLFSGTVSRYNTISGVLEALEMSKDVHFKMEGRTIIVMK